MKQVIRCLFLLLQVLLAAATSGTFYVFDDIESENSDTLDSLLSVSSPESPLVFMQFKKFQVVELVRASDASSPYLNKILQKEVTSQFTEDYNVDSIVSSTEDVFIIEELPSSAASLLYNYSLKGSKLVVFQFKNSNYNLSQLDEFLESVAFFLEETFGNADVKALIIDNASLSNDNSQKNVKTSVSSNGQHQKWNLGSNKDDKEDEDKDILSETWTEGLIMCLIVSFLLLGILVVALSWMSSLEISYGALQKSTSPMKKTN